MLRLESKSLQGKSISLKKIHATRILRFNLVEYTFQSHKLKLLLITSHHQTCQDTRHVLIVIKNKIMVGCVQIGS